MTRLLSDVVSFPPTGAQIDAGGPDPFDPSSLRLCQDFIGEQAVKVLTTVPCRKPGRQEFVRVRPEPEFVLDTLVLDDQTNREVYLIDPSIRAELQGESRAVRLVVATNRQGDVFLWPARLPGADGRSSSWFDSALAAVESAKTKWVRVVANMGADLRHLPGPGQLAGPCVAEPDDAGTLEAGLQEPVHQERGSPGGPGAAGRGLVERLPYYHEIWLADFEFRQPAGERPEPVCLVAREYRSGRSFRLWRDDLVTLAAPPFPIGPDALFVAYYASAELGCFRARLAAAGPDSRPLY